MSSEDGTQGGVVCSFCGTPQSDVKRIIAGPGKIFICDQCVILCQEIIVKDGEVSVVPEEGSLPEHPAIPKVIRGHLDEYVVSQGMAKKALSVAVYNHYKRVRSSAGTIDSGIEMEKSNILLIGPTGTGKTLLAQTLAKILNVPFAISDATSLTEAGYVGEDVEHILLRLIQVADWDIAKAEHGIIYIDEIDKITRKTANASITRDVSGEGVQQALLKIIEGTLASVPPGGGRKHPEQEYLQIRTDKILFICGGAFEGLDEIIERRVLKDRQTIGFLNASSRGAWDPDELAALKQVMPEDLLEYGFIPEFVGRMPITIALEELNQLDLIQILTDPKNAIVKQYQHLFSLDDVQLEFTLDGLEAAAQQALLRKTGARGLRSIIESTLLDVMYEVPSLPDVRRCVIDGSVIRQERPPWLLSAKGKPVEVLKNGHRQTA